MLDCFRRRAYVENILSTVLHTIPTVLHTMPTVLHTLVLQYLSTVLHFHAQVILQMNLSVRILNQSYTISTMSNSCKDLQHSLCLVLIVLWQIVGSDPVSGGIPSWSYDD